MKTRYLVISAALSLSNATAWASTDSDVPVENGVPENVVSFVGNDKALLAYKAVDVWDNVKSIALVMRLPKEPDPRLEKSADERVPYSCELIMLREEEGELRVTGRSQAAVDCEDNVINRRATSLELNDQLGLWTEKVTFMNDNIRGGSYSYSFAWSDGKWHLCGAEDFYKTFEEGVDEVLMVKETAIYPKDFGFIPMEKFTADDVRIPLSKNRSLVR